MAGYREFQTGEVLTAANVNDFLMDQSVMKFADAAARDTALGTAVGGANALREGMVAYLDSTDEVQFFDGTVWDAISQPPAGIGSNVVQTVKTDTFTTSSTSYTDITGFEVTITPSSATAKVLIICQFYAGNTGINQYTSWTLLRGATAIYQGDAAGSRNRATGSSLIVADTGYIAAQIACFLDSPTSASPVTYKAQMRVTGGTGVFGRTGADTDTINFSRTPASFTAIEVAA